METWFVNPVYVGDFPDPFVLKFRGEYWAYGTGAWRDGRWFGVLRSRDLVRWEELGGAMVPLPGSFPCLWAPEVSYQNGRFFLYYSLGDEARMQLRVAVADHPAGPFVDSGRRLSREPFAIDAHVFFDDDGTRHLFYATDFLDHSHMGTGTVRVKLADPLTPAGDPIPVTRPRYDWHVYDPERAEKGGVRWHTVEGPFVLKRKGRYYQMFSGGNWQNPSYGVSYALADSIDTPDEWRQTADGERVLPILRTRPGVVGPGHNSAVRGPNNMELFCVYHRWAADSSGRQMAIDRLDWAGERMLLLGPSVAPQPVLAPSFADFFAGEALGPAWRTAGGSWRVTDGETMQSEPIDALARLHALQPASFVAEVSLRLIAALPDSGYGLAFGDALRVLIQPGRRRLLVAVRETGTWREHTLSLPDGFAPETWHALRTEVNARRVLLQLDEATRWEGSLAQDGPLTPALCTLSAAAAFAGFAITAGWSDLFDLEAATPTELGWLGQGVWRVRGGALELLNDEGILRKAELPMAYELVLNGRLTGADGAYGFFPAMTADASGPLVQVAPGEAGPELRIEAGAERQRLTLPSAFDLSSFQQLRALVRGGSVALSWEGHALGSFPAAQQPVAVGLWGLGGAAFEAVRAVDVGQG